LKVSANVKIAMQCFENFGGANAPNAPLGCAPGPRCPLWLRAWWQLHSDCRLQTSAGIRDWAKFMCTPIWQYKL